VDAARRAGLAVIHVRVGFRPGMPEVSERGGLFAAMKASPERRALFDGPAGEIARELGPADGDIVVTKHRVSAFAGSGLEMILRARRVETMVLFGIATSGVVLSTLVEASDLDYDLVVVADCCADTDAELHEALLTRLFPRRARVVSAAEFVAGLEGA
jgi:nicotinamidase-related amidase